MGLAPSSSSPTEFSKLRLKRITDAWAQVDIGDLGGVDKFDVLRGASFPPDVGVADPKGRWGDLIGTYWAVLKLVTPVFVDVVRDAGLTGCVFRPVQTTGRADLGEVFLLQVSGRCGPRESAIRLLEPSGRIDAGSWDGSDFFVAPNYGAKFLSPRAAEVLTRARLRNVAVEPAGIVFD